MESDTGSRFSDGIGPWWPRHLGAYTYGGSASELAIDLAAVSYAHRNHHELTVADRVDHPMVATRIRHRPG